MVGTEVSDKMDAKGKGDSSTIEVVLDTRSVVATVSASYLQEEPSAWGVGRVLVSEVMES